MPSLRILEGPGAGPEIPLFSAETIVGRDKTADISLLDTMVSRQHAKIVLDGAQASLIDMNSSNGTFVNRLPVDRHPLEDGDELSIGETIFIFQDSEAGQGIRSDEFQAVASSNYNEELTVDIPDIPSAIRASEMGRFENLPNEQRELAILYELGRAINSTLKLHEILGHILDVIFETMPAQRGVVLLTDASTGKLRPKVIRPKEAGKEGMKVSQTILDYAVERGVGIFSTDASTDDRFLSSKSVATQVVRSLLCVPLKTRDEIVGVVYVDSSEGGKLDHRHLLMLSAVANQAAIAIENARLVDELQLENRSLRRQLSQTHHVVGSSPKMKQIYEMVRRVSPADTTILLRGESGVGKEVIARAIHQQSKRRSKQIVCVNCAALSPTLLEAELFGYERGAFTGATERRAGRFELANGGTLFLDEIGEMPAELQAKLLRVLQEREFERVGGTETLKVDVRIVTSTNRDLDKEMEEGRFRDDLYYRLKVIEILIPPLRDRKEDLPALIEQFLQLFSNDMGTKPPKISTEALAVAMSYNWPGNVRELKNLIERAVVLGVGDELLPEHFPDSVLHSPAFVEEQSEPQVDIVDDPAETQTLRPDSFTLADSEKVHIERILALCQWNKSRASEMLQISRPRLDRKIKEYELVR